MVISRHFLRRALPAMLGLAVAALAAPVARAEDTILAMPGQNVLFLARYIADDQHLWSKQGLNVKILDIIGIGSMNAVIAGSADFSMGSGPTITRAWARGQHVSALLTAISQSGQSVVIRKDIADATHFDPNAPLSVRGKILKGQTIAMAGVGAIPDIVLKVIAKDAGLAPTDVVATPMQPPEFMAAFANKQIAGFSNSPPFVEQVLTEGTAVLVSDARKGEPTEFSPVSASLLLARGDFCAAHKSTCEKMVHAIYEGTQIIRTDPQTSIAVMKAHFGTFSDKVLQAAYETVKAMTPDNPITTEQDLANGDNMNSAAGFLKPEDKLPDYKPLIDNSFVK
ncbi:MAG TPA: ABC transporter substrate-binding protein [Stellaceae bacterium]|jgi:ABC-type nitrate/sulfonate/bicarbonate transport system substrate-binding protein|nr:ABC transporter substrate-binding protein [Stellaceae bacterium]